MSDISDISAPLLVLLGPPGSGKSTLAETVLNKFTELGHFAVRRQFAIEKRDKTDLWLAAADSQEKRQWIPDEVVIEAFSRRLDEQLPGGMLIEGLPANPRQARLVIETVTARSRRIDKVMYLDAPDEVCMHRMRGRQVCITCDSGISQAPIAADAPDQCARCGSLLGRRPDDEDVAFAERLRLHRLYIDGILQEFRQDQVVVLNGVATRTEISETALRSLSGLGVA